MSYIIYVVFINYSFLIHCFEILLLEFILNFFLQLYLLLQLFHSLLDVLLLQQVACLVHVFSGEQLFGFFNLCDEAGSRLLFLFVKIKGQKLLFHGLAGLHVPVEFLLYALDISQVLFVFELLLLIVDLEENSFELTIGFCISSFVSYQLFGLVQLIEVELLLFGFDLFLRDILLNQTYHLFIHQLRTWRQACLSGQVDGLGHRQLLLICL